MVRQDDIHHLEWPLGKIGRVFPDSSGVIQIVEVEDGGQRSTRSVTFIVPLELDCEEAEAIPATEEGNQEAEREIDKESTQLAINRDEENGVENESPDQQLLIEPSTTPTTEGDYLQHSDTLTEPTQLASPESTSIDEAPAEPSDQESLSDEPTVRPRRRAAQRQRQLMLDLVNRDLI